MSRFGLGLALMALAAPQGFAAGAGHVKPMAHMPMTHIKPLAHAKPVAEAEQTGDGTVEMVEVSDAPVQAVREVDDRVTGVRWLLVRDAVHPAGPGQWIQVSERAAEMNGTEIARADLEANTPQLQDVQTGGVASSAAGSGAAGVKPPAPLVMRGGDPIVVVQQTPVLTARLSAVALEPAAAGKLIQARLKATDARVWVIAKGPGEATLAPPGLAPPGVTGQGMTGLGVTGQWRAR